MNGRLLSDAERELVEAMMDTSKGHCNSRDKRIKIAMDKIARLRLDDEIPGWEQEAKSAYFFYLRARETWYKWEDRLAKGRVHDRCGHSELVADWEKEFETQNK